MKRAGVTVIDHIDRSHHVVAVSRNLERDQKAEIDVAQVHGICRCQ